MEGELVRTAESFSLTAIVADNGIPRGLNALLTEGERVRRFGFLQSELDRAKKDLQRGVEQTYAERNKTNSNFYAEDLVTAFLQSVPSTSIEHDRDAVTKLLPGITLAEVNRLAGVWMTDRNRVLATTSPDKPGIVTPSAGELLLAFDAVKRADIAAYSESAPSQQLVDKDPAGGSVVSEKQIKEIGVTEWKLSNGVRVHLVQPRRRVAAAGRVVYRGKRCGSDPDHQRRRQIHRHRSAEVSRRQAGGRLSLDR